MFLKAYTFLDAKTGAHSAPMFFLTDGAMVRAAIELGMDMNTTIGRHPEDFILYYIGGFDDSTGMLHPGEFHNFGSVLSLLPKTRDRQIASIASQE